MAVNATLQVYPGAYMSEQGFAILVDGLSAVKSGILTGCTVTVSGTTLTVAPGWCSVRGRLVQVSGGSVSAAYASSGTKTQYLLLKVAVYGSGANDGKVSVFVSDNYSSDGADFNRSGGSAYLALATLTVTTNSITVASQQYLHTANLIENKVDKVAGKGLSSNDFTTEEKNKLAAIDGGSGTYTDVVRDANYVHTDNNFTTVEKNKLASIDSGSGSYTDLVRDANYVHTDNNFTNELKTKLQNAGDGEDGLGFVTVINEDGTRTVEAENAKSKLYITATEGVKVSVEEPSTSGDISLKITTDGVVTGIRYDEESNTLFASTDKGIEEEVGVMQHDALKGITIHADGYDPIVIHQDSANSAMIFVNGFKVDSNGKLKVPVQDITYGNDTLLTGDRVKANLKSAVYSYIVDPHDENATPHDHPVTAAAIAEYVQAQSRPDSIVHVTGDPSTRSVYVDDSGSPSGRIDIVNGVKVNGDTIYPNRGLISIDSPVTGISYADYIFTDMYDVPIRLSAVVYNSSTNEYETKYFNVPLIDSTLDTIRPDAIPWNYDPKTTELANKSTMVLATSPGRNMVRLSNDSSTVLVPTVSIDPSTGVVTPISSAFIPSNSSISGSLHQDLSTDTYRVLATKSAPCINVKTYIIDDPASPNSTFTEVNCKVSISKQPSSITNGEAFNIVVDASGVQEIFEDSESVIDVVITGDITTA